MRGHNCPETCRGESKGENCGNLLVMILTLSLCGMVILINLNFPSLCSILSIDINLLMSYLGD